jgi:aminotransferase in exopolysaccharide biosynthesis
MVRNTATNITSTTSEQFERLIAFVRDELYGQADSVPLHVPTFDGRESEYVQDAIDSTFVSSVGQYVDRFEAMIAEYTGAARAVATVNGTAALHTALHLIGVGPDDLVVTQPVSFVATANAIKYTGADPVFVDVDPDTLGLSPQALRRFFEDDCQDTAEGTTIHRSTGRRVAACIPMHTFGLPLRIEEVVELCAVRGIPVVEDAAESLGSFVATRHMGTFGRLGILSFNGNKTITTGGGGMIITNDDELGRHAKHVTTTAKVPHTWEYIHDELGFNYRLPNLNAALGCAQMEQLEEKIDAKRALHDAYGRFFDDGTWREAGYEVAGELPGTRANYWLNVMHVPDRETRDELLKETNDAGVMTRPLWELSYRLPAFAEAPRTTCPVSEQLADTVVNLPSWPPPHEREA